MPDEEANIFKVRYLHGRHGCICGGHKREGGWWVRITRGGLPICLVLPLSRDDGRCWQKSAEGIVGLSTGLKART
jgi:hypothetical protein